MVVQEADEEGITEGCKVTFDGNRYVHYLDCDDMTDVCNL